MDSVMGPAGGNRDRCIFLRSARSGVLASSPFWHKLSTAWEMWLLESARSSAMSAAVSRPGLFFKM